MRTFSALNTVWFALLCLCAVVPAGCSTPVPLTTARPGMLTITIHSGVPLTREAFYRRLEQIDRPLLVPEGCSIDLALTDFMPEREVFSFREPGDSEVRYEIVPSSVKATARIIKHDKTIRTCRITATGNTSEELIDSCISMLAGIFAE